jgi:tryptophanyl-tRNA synthetase
MEVHMKKVLFSGSRPSGTLTLGNYLGAISQWKRFQDEYESIFCIVDLHAMTTPEDLALLKMKSLDFLALYIACELNPEKSIIFIQSQNPYHTELAWILSCCTAYGDLTRMTQFKEKSLLQKSVTAGLLNYPVLMAADILLYKTALVPIGEDQKQHLELCRNIAQRFNSRFGEIFRIPEALIPNQGGRIRNLLDPTKKMDKSHQNARTYISLLDADDQVRSKIMKAKTDSKGDFNIDNENEGIANLVTIMSKLETTSTEEIVVRYRGKGYGKLKKDLADTIIGFLRQIRQNYREIREDTATLERLQRRGKEKAIERSRATIKEVKEACGLFA